ncbi:MAG: fasciclin domain-containing protein [Planctomycetota bacterium]|nr:fasciclin domain-containing protein [Planctomycetota bacterium]
MRCSSFRLALGVALALPLASAAVADECPLAAAKKAQAKTHVQTVAFKAAPKDIVDTAVGAGTFKTLVAAVQAADLVETLKGAGPFTVFAPTDEAFAKLPAGTVETLLKPENKEKLVAVLTYHVVPGKVMAADVVKLTEAPTVQGAKAKVKVADGAVMIDNAKVVKTDIETSNGVIHVIDAVILPPDGK